MRKIISLFQRNYEGDRRVRNEIVPAAEWVIAGEGEATRKFDGTCCLFRGGKLYRRYEVKLGGRLPPNFEPAMDEVDQNTGKLQGWVPVGDGPEDKWHREAFARGFAILCPTPNKQPATLKSSFREGQTYELVGEKIQGNPEGAEGHQLVTHGQYLLPRAPRDFDGLREYFKTANIEGIVWHHPDGRMVKIKAKDFGLKR